jgi:soluble P-type ATPase
MLEITIPGSEALQLEYLVLDYNGTLACDGALLAGVADALHQLATQLTVHVVTADTYGQVSAVLDGLPCKLAILSPGHQDAAKRDYVETLGANRCVAIGNGRNDRLMLKRAVLGIAVAQAEGVAVETVLAADVLVPDILAAFGLLLNPTRLIATLRV